MREIMWPMQPPGGAFLIGIGAGIAVGAGALAATGALQTFVAPMLAGAAAGAAFLVAARIWGSGRFGRPSRPQVLALIVAIALEITIFWGLSATGRFAVWDERTGMSTALAVVAAHFLVMRLSHGPPMLWLGVLALAWIGLSDLLRLPLALLVLGDGLLKAGVGAAMARPIFIGMREAGNPYPAEAGVSGRSPAGSI